MQQEILSLEDELDNKEIHPNLNTIKNYYGFDPLNKSRSGCRDKLTLS